MHIQDLSTQADIWMFSRTIRLLEAGIKLVYVFDGKPLELKKKELARRFSKREDATEDLNAAIETGNAEKMEKFCKRTVKNITLSLQEKRVMKIYQDKIYSVGYSLDKVCYLSVRLFVFHFFFLVQALSLFLFSCYFLD